MKNNVTDRREGNFYFAHSATLRIAGKIQSMEEISRQLDLQPTYTHFKGDKRTFRSKPYQADMWSYKAPVPEDRPLGDHIDELWKSIRSKREYLKDLKKQLSVDIFLGYRTDCETAGIEVPHTSLEAFIELEIPFGLSIIIA